MVGAIKGLWGGGGGGICKYHNPIRKVVVSDGCLINTQSKSHMNREYSQRCRRAWCRNRDQESTQTHTIEGGLDEHHLLVVLRWLQLAGETSQCGGLGSGGVLWSEASQAWHLPLPQRGPHIWRPLPRSCEQPLMKGVEVVGHAICLTALGLLQHCSRRSRLLEPMYPTSRHTEMQLL